MDKAVQPAPAARPIPYERRRPEETILYQLVQEHLETFLAQIEAETGAGLPEFVEEEFEAFLECGILAHGFLRLRCAECAHEKLVAFSCKKRGFCPACGARRMAETAAHLVDHVIPRVPVRQWVLAFPIPLRLLFATHPHLLSPALQIVHRVISTFLIQQTGSQRTEAKTGAVTLIQRFGSAANLNIHLHCLVLDGVYRTTEGVPAFHPVPAPTAEQLQVLLTRIIKRLMKVLTRKGFLIEEQGMSYLDDSDPDRALGPLRAAACTYRIAFGPRAGQKVLTLQTLPSETALRQKRVTEAVLAPITTASYCCGVVMVETSLYEDHGRASKRQATPGQRRRPRVYRLPARVLSPPAAPHDAPSPLASRPGASRRIPRAMAAPFHYNRSGCVRKRQSQLHARTSASPT